MNDYLKLLNDYTKNGKYKVLLAGTDEDKLRYLKKYLSRIKGFIINKD